MKWEGRGSGRGKGRERKGRGRGRGGKEVGERRRERKVREGNRREGKGLSI